jgi:hypothetical protein
MRFAHQLPEGPLLTVSHGAGTIYRCDSRTHTMAKPQSRQLVVCIDNEGYAASLEKRKIYVALRDPVAEKHGLLRVIDESGDDYLYPKMFFCAIALPQAVKKAVLAAA